MTKQEKIDHLRAEIANRETEHPYVGAFAGRARAGMVRKFGKKTDALRKRLAKLEGRDVVES